MTTTTQHPAASDISPFWSSAALWKRASQLLMPVIQISSAGKNTNEMNNKENDEQIQNERENEVTMKRDYNNEQVRNERSTRSERKTKIDTIDISKTLSAKQQKPSVKVK